MNSVQLSLTVVLSLVLLSAASKDTTSQQTNNAVPKPNILLIVADSLGYNDIGYNAKNHGSVIKTPHLDHLASTGVILGNYYVQPTSTPTRSQLLTGRYQIHTGLQHHSIEPARPMCLPDDEVTLAQKMKESGYTTHMIGKWHLGFYKDACLPTHRGFDSFLGCYLGTEDYYKHNKTWTETQGETKFTVAGFDFHQDTPTSSEAAHQYDGQYSTHVFAQEAKNIIKKHKPSDKPFFLYLPFQAAQRPVEVDMKYMLPFKKLKGHRRRRKLAGVIKCLDEAISNITTALRDAKLMNNTIIIFSTDGGADGEIGNNWPLRGARETLWEGALHGVGFVSSSLLPTKVQGTTSQALIHVSDWFPTIVSSLAGGSLNGTKPLNGFDVWDAIIKGSVSPRKELLHNIDPLHHTPSGILAAFNTSINAALRKGDWKIITGYPGSEKAGGNDNGWIPPVESGLEPIPSTDPEGKNTWLFNITADPNEKSDLSKEHSSVVKEMLSDLDKYYAAMTPPIWPDPDPNCDPAKRKDKGVWGPWK